MPSSRRQPGSLDITSQTANDRVRRPTMATENVAVLLLGTLLAGLIVGVAIGRRQGMTVKQVALPPDAMSGMHSEETTGTTAPSNEEMAKTAPKAPTTLPDARDMIEKMGPTTPDELISLGDRKFGNGKFYLAAAFYEKALKDEPKHAGAWFNLGQCYEHVGEAALAKDAYTKCLANGPDEATAAKAKQALK